MKAVFCSAALCAVCPRACLINRCRIIPMTQSVWNCRFGRLSGRFRIILLPFSVISRRALYCPSLSTMTHCVSFTLCARQLCLSLTKGMKQYFETDALPLNALITFTKRPPYFRVSCWIWQFITVSPLVVQRGCSSHKGEKGGCSTLLLPTYISN